MVGFRPILAHGSRQSGWPCAARVVSLGRGTALVTAHISSRQNPLVARFKAAAEASDGSLLLDGAHLVSEALAAGLALECVALDPDRISPQERAALTRAVPAAELVTVSRAVLEAISPVRTPSGVVALAARPTHTLGDLLAGRSRLVLGAVDVQDPGNVGAIVRAAEAGGASGVVCTAHGADPFGWKALRGAMGSAFRLPVTRVPAIDEATAAARAAGCRIVATVGRGGASLYDVDLTGSTLLLLGSEGHGLAPAVVDAADARVSIPMDGAVESLNVAVAAALLVYEARRQRQAQPR
jgi:TrmH family RNA methyltransferase